MLRVTPGWMPGYAGVILLVAVLVNLSAQLPRNTFGLVLPSMERSLDLSHFQAGSLFTAMAMLLMVASLTFGMLAPRYGSRITVGLSATVVGLAMIFLGSSPSFAVAVLASALVGFAAGGCTTPVMGLLSVWFSSRNRGTVAGLAAAGGGVSFVIIGAVVPWLTGRDPDDGWRHSWYVLATFVIAIGILSLAFLRDQPTRAAGVSRVRMAWPVEAYKNEMVWLISFLAFCSSWCNTLFATFFGIYLEDQGISLAVIGRLWGLLGVLGILSGVFWGILSDRLGRRAGFLLSFIILGAGSLLFGLTPAMIGLIASVILVGMSNRATYTICAASAGDYVPPHMSAAAFGLMGVGAGLGSSMAPLVGGRIADATGDPGLVFLLATGATAVGVVASAFLSRPRPLLPS